MQTRCPACGTAFRITPEQLRVKGGRVRCGHCRAVFNSLAYLVEERKPTPPVAEPPLPSAIPLDSTAAAEADLPSPPIPAESFSIDQPQPAEDFSDGDNGAAAPASETDTTTAVAPKANPVSPEAATATGLPPEAEEELREAPPETATATTEAIDPQAQIDALIADLEAGTRDIPEAPITLSDPPTERILEIDLDPDSVAETPAETLAGEDDDYNAPLQPVNRQGPLWLFVSVAGILAALLGLQLAYHLRTELCNSFPDLHPLYAALDIDVPLAHNPEQISLETSDLQADAAHNALVLYATIKNKASHPQAWPMLELTLTDERENVIARRSFSAEEYLSRTDGQEVTQDPEAPFAAHAEVSLRLWLDAREIRAAGYRVYLYYP